MNKSDKIDQLALALHKVQAEVKNPSFDSTNPHFKSKFASLASVREAVLPILNKHGLSLSQFPKAGDGTAGCVNLLVHFSGQWVEEDCLLPLDKNNAQGAGSAITYARRYSLQGIAGVVAEEDDDANAASAPAKPLSVSGQVWETMDEEEKKFLQGLADQVRESIQKDGGLVAMKFLEEQNLTQDEKVAIWSRFDSKERAAMEPHKRPKKVA